MGGNAIMSKSFINLHGDYFETLTEPTQEILTAHLENGVKEVPSRPSPLHTWSGTAWQAPSAEAVSTSQAADIRDRRDFLLASKVDRIVSNSLRWADMGEAKQNEWIEYRKALLNVTNQSTFPKSVVWPYTPE